CVPMRFMTSTMGRYFYEFGVTVTVAVAISALVALTLTPMLCSRMLRHRPSEGATFRLFERGLRGLEGFYAGVLRWSLRHRLASVLLAAATVASGCWVRSTLPVDYFTQDDMSEAQITAKHPIGTPLSVNEQTLRPIAHSPPHFGPSGQATPTRAAEDRRERDADPEEPAPRADRHHLRGTARARGGGGAAGCAGLGRVPGVRELERRGLERDHVRDRGARPRPTRALRGGAAREDGGGRELRRRAQLLRERATRGDPRRRPRARRRRRRLLGRARAHAAHAPRRREGERLRGRREPLRRARAGAARVPRRPRQARPDPRALAARRPRPDHRPRVGARGIRPGRDPPPQPRADDPPLREHDARVLARGRDPAARRLGA